MRKLCDSDGEMGKTLKKVVGDNSVRTFDCSDWASSIGQHLRDGPGSLDETWLSRVGALHNEIPAPLRAALQAFLEGQGPVGLHLTGLPVPDVLPPTPPDCQQPPARTERNAEFWLALFGSHLGFLFSHAEICDGDLFHHVAPQPGEEDAPSGESSRSPLRLHTDGASHPFPPDFILLWCHRDISTVQTRLVLFDAAMDRLNTSDVEQLSRGGYRHQLDYEFERCTSAQLTAPKFLVDRDEEAPRLRLDVDFVVPPDDEPLQALHNLETTAEGLANLITLQAGEILVLDNARALHGRSAFEPRYDGTDRWLQVGYVRRPAHGVPSGVALRDRVARRL